MTKVRVIKTGFYGEGLSEIPVGTEMDIGEDSFDSEGNLKPHIAATFELVGEGKGKKKKLVVNPADEQGGQGGQGGATDAKPKDEVLALADGPFFLFKAEAEKLLGKENIPGTKDEIIAALNAL